MTPEELAEHVIEQMTQDKGPANCERYARWAWDLAEAVLGQRAAMDRARQQIEHCTCGCAYLDEASEALRLG